MASVISDQLNDSLSCQICNLRFNTTSRVPKAFSCMHTICTQCIKSLIDAHALSGSFPCPLCRQEITIPDDKDASKFPTNLALAEIIDVTKDVFTSEICDLHPGQAITSMCMDCKVGLCVKCIIPLATCQHKDHDMKDLDDALIVIKKMFEEYCPAGAEVVKLYEEAYDQTRVKVLEEVHDKKQSILKEVDDEYTRLEQDIEYWHQEAKKNMNVNLELERDQSQGTELLEAKAAASALHLVGDMTKWQEKYKSTVHENVKKYVSFLEDNRKVHLGEIQADIDHNTELAPGEENQRLGKATLEANIRKITADINDIRTFLEEDSDDLLDLEALWLSVVNLCNPTRHGSQHNSSVFLAEQGPELLIQTYNKFDGEENILKIYALLTLTNLAAHSPLRQLLLRTDIVQFLTNVSGSSEDYQVVNMALETLVSLLYESPHVWFLQTIKREAVLDTIRETLRKIRYHTKCGDHDLTDPILFLSKHDCPAIQHWAIWNINNDLHDSQFLYTNVLRSEGGIKAIEDLLSHAQTDDEMKCLCRDALLKCGVKLS